jgi:hypothetical protein
MESWRVVGQQKFRVENDTVHWDLCGNLSGHELITIFEEGVRIQSVHGYALFHINVVGDWSFPSEARQALVQFLRTHTAAGSTAIVGLSAKMAMFIDLVVRGAAKVTGQRPNTRFFRTPQEAEAWLSDERVQFREGPRAPEK